MSDRYPQRTAAEFRKAIEQYRGNRNRLTHLLFAAMRARNLPVIRQILDEGISVDAIDMTEPVPGLIINNLRRPTSHGLCALAFAGRLGGNANDLKIANFFLDQGARATGPGTILLCRVEVLSRFLDGGADIDARGEDHNPLLYAIESRTKQDKALALIQAGADLTVTDPRGFTPLHSAIMNGRKDTAEALLQAGADCFALDRSDRSPFRLGIESLAELHFQTDSNIRATRSVLRLLRDALPAQPEDIFLAALAFDEPASIERQLKDRPGWTHARLPGPPGPFGIDMQTILKRDGLMKGLAFGLELIEECDTPWPLLSWAVLLNAPKCVRWMVKAGADPHLKMADLPSPIELATLRRAKKAVHQALVEE